LPRRDADAGRAEDQTAQPCGAPTRRQMTLH
jgi:hypothetical protein